MTAYMPALSEDGWVTPSLKMVDILFAHFLVSDYSQTFIYPKQVKSLPEILTKTSVPKDLDNVITQELETYYGAYFDEVELDITVTQDDLNSNILSIYFSIIVRIEDGSEWELSKIIEIKDNKVSKVILVNN